jgi:hypothetical protein
MEWEHNLRIAEDDTANATEAVDSDLEAAVRGEGLCRGDQAMFTLTTMMSVWNDCGSC